MVTTRRSQGKSGPWPTTIYSSLSHVIPITTTPTTRIEKGEREEIFKNLFWMGYLCLPTGTSPWTQREHQGRWQRDSTTPHKWIHLHFLSCLCWERARISMCFKGPSRSLAHQDRNSGAHGLRPESKATCSMPQENSCCVFVLFVDTGFPPVFNIRAS